MKISVLFKDAAAAHRARRELRQARLLRWSDLVSVHDRRIQVDQLPPAHTSARGGALFGALTVGLVSAVVLAAITVNLGTGPGLLPAVALGLGAGAFFGGIFGAIAFATRPAAFIRKQRDELSKGRAMLVCDVPDPHRAERIRDRLEKTALPQAA